MGKRVRIYLERDYSAAGNNGTNGESIGPDLVFIHIWIVLTVATLIIPYLRNTLFSSLFTLPVLVFIPGYCVSSVIYPDPRAFSSIRRVLVSLGLSMAVAFPAVILFAASPWGIQLIPVVLIMVIVSILTVPVIQYRRFQSPDTGRHEQPVREPAVLAENAGISPEPVAETWTIYAILFVLLLALMCSPVMYFLLDFP